MNELRTWCAVLGTVAVAYCMSCAVLGTVAVACCMSCSLKDH